MSDGLDRKTIEEYFNKEFAGTKLLLRLSGLPKDWVDMIQEIALSNFVAGVTYGCKETRDYLTKSDKLDEWKNIDTKWKM